MGHVMPECIESSSESCSVDLSKYKCHFELGLDQSKLHLISVSLLRLNFHKHLFASLGSDNFLIWANAQQNLQ